MSSAFKITVEKKTTFDETRGRASACSVRMRSNSESALPWTRLRPLSEMTLGTQLHRKKKILAKTLNNFSSSATYKQQRKYDVPISFQSLFEGMLASCPTKSNLKLQSYSQMYEETFDEKIGDLNRMKLLYAELMLVYPHENKNRPHQLATKNRPTHQKKLSSRASRLMHKLSISANTPFQYEDNTKSNTRSFSRMATPLSITKVKHKTQPQFRNRGIVVGANKVARCMCGGPDKGGDWGQSCQILIVKSFYYNGGRRFLLSRWNRSLSEHMTLIRDEKRLEKTVSRNERAWSTIVKKGEEERKRKLTQRTRVRIPSTRSSSSNHSGHSLTPVGSIKHLKVHRRSSSYDFSNRVISSLPCYVPGCDRPRLRMPHRPSFGLNRIPKGYCKEHAHEQMNVAKDVDRRAMGWIFRILWCLSEINKAGIVQKCKGSVQPKTLTCSVDGVDLVGVIQSGSGTSLPKDKNRKRAVYNIRVENTIGEQWHVQYGYNAILQFSEKLKAELIAQNLNLTLKPLPKKSWGRHAIEQEIIQMRKKQFDEFFKHLTSHSTYKILNEHTSCLKILQNFLCFHDKGDAESAQMSPEAFTRYVKNAITLYRKDFSFPKEIVVALFEVLFDKMQVPNFPSMESKQPTSSHLFPSRLSKWTPNSSSYGTLQNDSFFSFERNDLRAAVVIEAPHILSLLCEAICACNDDDCLGGLRSLMWILIRHPPNCMIIAKQPNWPILFLHLMMPEERNDSFSHNRTLLFRKVDRQETGDTKFQLAMVITLSVLRNFFFFRIL